MADVITAEAVYLHMVYESIPAAFIRRHQLTDGLLVEIAREVTEAITDNDEWGLLLDDLAGSSVVVAFLSLWPLPDFDSAAKLLGIIAGSFAPDEIRERLNLLLVKEMG